MTLRKQMPKGQPRHAHHGTGYPKRPTLARSCPTSFAVPRPEVDAAEPVAAAAASTAAVAAEAAGGTGSMPGPRRSSSAW